MCLPKGLGKPAAAVHVLRARARARRGFHPKRRAPMARATSLRSRATRISADKADLKTHTAVSVWPIAAACTAQQSLSRTVATLPEGLIPCFKTIGGEPFCRMMKGKPLVRLTCPREVGFMAKYTTYRRKPKCAAL